MNLYQITQELLDGLNAFAENPDGFDEESFGLWLNDRQGQANEYRLATAALIKNEMADIEALEKMEKEIQDRQLLKKNNVEKYKKGLLYSMVSTGIKLVPGVEFDITWRFNNHATVITNHELIPEDYVHFEELKKIDKAAIAADIKAGKVVPGAHLEQSKSIQIK